MTDPVSTERITRLQRWLKYRVAATSDGKPGDIEETIFALLDSHARSGPTS